MNVNRDGPAGTVAAFRQSAPMNTLPVGANVLVGPDGGAVAGLVDDESGPGPGAAIDGAIADLTARVEALEAGEIGEVP